MQCAYFHDCNRILVVNKIEVKSENLGTGKVASSKIKKMNYFVHAMQLANEASLDVPAQLGELRRVLHLYGA